MSRRLPDDWYSFYVEDRSLVEAVTRVVRQLLKRPTLNPLRVHQIGAFLFGLQRLPRLTPGLAMSISLTTQYGDDIVTRSITIDDYHFELADFAIIHLSGVAGSDHESFVWFEVFAGEGREDRFHGYYDEWIAVLGELAEDDSTEIDIEDYGNIAYIDWDDPGNPADWDKLPSDYVF